MRQAGIDTYQEHTQAQRQRYEAQFDTSRVLNAFPTSHNPSQLILHVLRRRMNPSQAAVSADASLLVADRWLRVWRRRL